MRIYNLLLIASLLLYTSFAQGQGCSDAGFCTMGAMKPDQKFEKKLNFKLRSVEISHYYGLTRFNDKIFAYTVDLTLGISPKTQAQIKLPYQRVSGPMAETHGLGDISLSITRNLISKEHLQLNFTLGGKIPTGNPTKLDEKGRPLPMYYQTTLGTYDVVAGLSLINRNWLFAVGYQQALNSVENQFLWGPWSNTLAGNNDITEDFFGNQVKKYPRSTTLKRGSDIMLRTERNFRFSRFNINAGLLYIYRLNKDKITVNEDEQRVNDTNGLAMTGLLGGGYRLTPKSSIKVMFGLRIVKRHFNPDGLSREFVNTIGYELRF